MHDKPDLATTIDDSFEVSRLSTGSSGARWAIAVFAHNEARGIRSALQSITAAAGGNAIDVYVLANGCTDSTVAEVRACANILDNLWLVATDVADKANAWNLYVHQVIETERQAAYDVFFCMDGDVTLQPYTMPLLAAALREVPSAEAAGGMPASGRDRDAWRQRMVNNAMLAGNYYAMRGSFVQSLRQRQIRMPAGLIGEDFFVSWLIASNIWRDEAPRVDGPRCVFHTEAEFSFRSLSPWRLSDYRVYIRRRWRYTLRALQHQMLILLLTTEGMSAMPVDVEELYRRGPLPSRMLWVGRDTLLRLVALQQIRQHQIRQ